MTRLTVSNATINAISVGKIESDFGFIADGLNTNSVTINSSSIVVGNVTVIPPALSTPSLIVGGTSYAGGLLGGIIDYQEFSANGTWYNPYANASVNSALTGYEQVLVMAWGGGGGGSSNTASLFCGGGGACVIGNYSLANLSNTVSVTVGLGGAGVRSAGALAIAGNGTSSSFGSLVAYGGGGATSSSPGSGGGTLSRGEGVVGDGGDPLGGVAGNPGGSSTLGGGGAPTTADTAGGASVFGGGGAGRGSGHGGISIYGGGGGGSPSVTGNSVLGGSGGGGGLAGSVPGGGGSANLTVANSGARGEVRVWTFGPATQTLGPPTYTVTANTTAVYPGDTILYTVSTTGVANGSTLYYTLNNSSSALSTDFSSPSNGSFTVSGGVGTFSLTANSRIFASNTGMTIDIRTGSTTGPIVAANNSTLIRRTPTLTYLSHNFQDGLTAYTNVTITGASLGTAAADRKIVVSVLGYNMTESVTCTIAGIPATIARSIINLGVAPWWDNYVFIADVPTGTTGNILITNAVGQYGSYSAAVYALYGAGSSTPVSTAISETNSATSLNNALTNLGKSCVILTSTGQYLSNVTNPMSITVNDPNAVVTTNVNDVQIDTQYAFMVEHAVISNNYNLSTTCTSTFTSATDAAVSSSVAFR